MTPFFLVVLGLGNSLHGNTQYFSQLFSQTLTWSAVIGIRNQLIITNQVIIDRTINQFSRNHIMFT